MLPVPSTGWSRNKVNPLGSWWCALIRIECWRTRSLRPLVGQNTVLYVFGYAVPGISGMENDTQTRSIEQSGSKHSNQSFHHWQCNPLPFFFFFSFNQSVTCHLLIDRSISDIPRLIISVPLLWRGHHNTWVLTGHPVWPPCSIYLLSDIIRDNPCIIYTTEIRTYQIQ